MRTERIIRLSRLVPEGRWTTYGTISEIVYGHPRGAQTVGTVIRADGHVDSAHRTLRAGGRIAPEWRGIGGGDEECLRRLRRERIWDESRGRARPDCFIDAEHLRRLEA